MTLPSSGQRGSRVPANHYVQIVAIVALFVFGAPFCASGQGSGGGNGVRFGVTVGGISTVGLTAEFFRNSRSIDITLGTWAFRDVSLSVVGKQYLGGRDLRPFAGAGLWLVVAKPSDARTGLGLVARVPIGVDWRVGGSHSVGGAVSLNRALAVRRPDPEDELPLTGRLVPLPGLYYRWTR